MREQLQKPYLWTFTSNKKSKWWIYAPEELNILNEENIYRKLISRVYCRLQTTKGDEWNICSN